MKKFIEKLQCILDELKVPKEIYELNHINQNEEFEFIQLNYHNMKKQNKEVIYEFSKDEFIKFEEGPTWDEDEELMFFQLEVQRYILDSHIREFKFDLLSEDDDNGN